MKTLRQLLGTGPKNGDNLLQMINYVLKLTHDRMEHREIMDDINQENKSHESPPMKEKKNPTKLQRI